MIEHGHPVEFESQRSTMAMIDHGILFSKFISLLKHIIKTAAFRSYRSVISVLLQLIRHYQSVINGKEEAFRGWPGGLASSSQPATNQHHSAPPISLAMPLLEAPLQSIHTQVFQLRTDVHNLQITTPGLHGWPNNAALNTASPPHFPPPLIPEQASVITLIPIVPDPQVAQYERNVFMYVYYISPICCCSDR